MRSSMDGQNAAIPFGTKLLYLNSPNGDYLRLKSDKQSVFDNPSDLAQVTRERLGIGNPVEYPIQQEVKMAGIERDAWNVIPIERGREP